jgi:uncharacterized membrane protein
MGKLKINVREGVTEHIALSGARTVDETILLSFGSFSVSRKAFLLGSVLIVCQILDGILTYIGLSGAGHAEGNSLLRFLMQVYGVAPTLFFVKSFAVLLVVLLTWHAHKRKWIRPIIFGLVIVYCTLAIAPWLTIVAHKIGAAHVQTSENQRATSVH